MGKNNQSYPSLGTKLLYWKQSAANLLRMGHCAPTVMQTLLDVSGAQKEWLVKLTAGMPGGIGNTGVECGAVTSPLVLMGLRYGLREENGGLPAIFDHGHGLCQRFISSHKTIHCKQIRGKDRFPKHCIRPVCLSPQIFMASLSNDGQTTIPPEKRETYHRIHSHWVKENFHCARAVFDHLQYTAEEHPELFDAVSAFVGGTMFMGMTCSAFTAGVMVVGLRIGEIENSPLKVIRLLGRMTFGGNAFDEKINKFNRSMNIGYRMAKWFRTEFGSTQCQAITKCDFSTAAGASKYIENDCIARCEEIVAKVAEMVRKILIDLETIQAHPSVTSQTQQEEVELTQ